jgi:hypothetical protein
MPAPIDESIKRKVIQQRISGEPRDKIATENNIGAETVSSIVNNYKVGFESSDFESVRELALEIRKQGLNLSDSAFHIRLYKYFRESGVAEEQTESFVTNINSSEISPEKMVECVNQLYDISKKESIPIEQVPSYIKQKLQEKQRIDEKIKEADATLQSKNMSVEAINEHIHQNHSLVTLKCL